MRRPAVYRGFPRQTEKGNDVTTRSAVRIATVAVATALTLSTASTAFASQPRTVDLGVLPGGTGGFAFDVNNKGSIVGHANNAGGVNRAVLWDARGLITDLGTLPGDTSATAYTINEKGTAVVGQSLVPGGAARPVKWTPDGTATALATPA